MPVITRNMASQGSNPPTARPIKKVLSLWAQEGLDPTSLSFNKLHASESKHEEKLEKYDLKPEKFRNYAKSLMEKVTRIYAIKEFTVASAGTDKNVIKEHSTIRRSEMQSARNSGWLSSMPTYSNQSDMDKFTDSQIKASVIGNYIHESLTEDSREQLEADSAMFKVKDDSNVDHYDGASYFHCIARLVE